MARFTDARHRLDVLSPSSKGLSLSARASVAAVDEVSVGAAM